MMSASHLLAIAAASYLRDWPARACWYSYAPGHLIAARHRRSASKRARHRARGQR